MSRRLSVPVLALGAFAALGGNGCSKPEEGKASATSGASAAVISAPAKPSTAEPSPSGAAPGAPKAHSDHNPRHGGVLTMEGDNHVEIVVSAEGAIDIYVSDALRNPTPVTDISGTMLLEPTGSKEKQKLALVADAAKGSLSVKGPAPKVNTDYTWDLRVKGEKLLMTLRVPEGGTSKIEQKPHSHEGGEHSHGSPHGGVVASLDTGHVEVKVEATGAVTLWMLGDAEDTQSAKGVTASLRPVVAGAKEIALKYDDKLDALVGKAEGLKDNHFDAIVSVTRAGGKPFPVRMKF